MSNAITIKNFSYAYPDGTDALSEIDLTIEHGEKVGLIGPNGAGKSTILLAINIFIKGSGLIEVDGIEAVSKNARKIRTVINSVLQDPDEQLFMPTLFEDVAFGPMNMGLSPADVDKQTLNALSKVGLSGMEKKMPHHLSAGQKRAAAIATVLSMDPKIITMDEPDTSLDPANRKKLISLLCSLSQTFVIATCSMNFAANLCERVILVDGGKIIADGKAEEIMSDQQLMESHGLEVPTRYYKRPSSPTD